MAKGVVAKFKLETDLQSAFKAQFEKEQKEYGGKYKKADMYENIARVTGLMPSTIAQLSTKGSKHPNLLTLLMLADYFNIQIFDMVKMVPNDEFIDPPLCVVDGCDRIGTTRGYCLVHVNTTEGRKSKSNEDA